MKFLRRHKGHGRLFQRGGVWYLRYRCNGIETTKTTGVAVDESSDEAMLESIRKANAVLEKETEILRLQDKSSRLKIVKLMLEDTNEKIKDMISGIQRDARLRSIVDIFKQTSRRSVCSDAQMKTYCRYLYTLVGHIGESVRICDIDESVADSFASWLEEGRSPNTYNKHLNGYAYVWNAIAGRIGIDANPWKTIPRKRLDTSVRRALTDEECERLLANTKGEMRLLIGIGLYTGLRLGDACRLRWSDIRDGAIFKITDKTGAEVAVPLHPRLKKLLESEGGKEGEFVTPMIADMYNKHGNGLVVRHTQRAFRDCGIETSVRKGTRARPVCGFHSLRATFVTRCTAAGISQAVVQALVGHASQKMTQHYTHLQNKDILNAFKEMK